MSSSSLLTPPQQRPAFYRSISSNSQSSSKPSRTAKALAITRTFSHQKDKLRLYLAVFSRGGSAGGAYGSQLTCDSYHWAIILGPKSPLRTEAGTAYHIVHSSPEFGNLPYLYEETDLKESPHLARNLLARIALAKVVDEDRVPVLLRSLAQSLNLQSKSLRGSVDSARESNLTCLSFAKAAWEALAEDGQRPLKSYFGGDEWDGMEIRARKYVRRKRQQGRYSHNVETADVTWNAAEVPTWNYWENRETTD